MAKRQTLYYGVDFSGAVDAGRKVWVSRAVFDPLTEVVTIQSTQRAADAHGGGKSRDAAYAWLRDQILRAGDAVWGMDFPFGVSAPLNAYMTWAAFVLRFADDYPTPFSLYERGREIKPPRRHTDIEAKTPFAPHNLRLFRQTYHGIRDVIAPLVADNAVNVPPMTAILPGRPTMLEICPASLLKTRGWYFPYKGSSADHLAARAQLVHNFGFAMHESVRAMLLADKEGDALDSAIAAYQTATSHARGDIEQALADPDPIYRLEARVFGLI